MNNYSPTIFDLAPQDYKPTPTETPKVYKITFSVPLDQWERTKDRILLTYFETDEPTFTRHKPNNGREYATFTANYKADIMTLFDLLPSTALIH